MIRLKKIEGNTESKEDWWIVRKPDYVPETSSWIPELSPTYELYTFYMGYYEKGTWTKRHFDELYVPRFIEDLKNNPKGQMRLKELKERSFLEDLNLCCYCPDESICHRSIIGGILLGMGADIECDPEYIKYYQLFIQ